MNQQKIGEFIAKMRKEKDLTQAELANKLNVTDRAISNWENGRRMPDVSLFKPLCEELDISVNELLSGEKISKKDLESKSDETIINAIKRVKKIKFTYKTIISLLLFIVAVAICMFSIDIERMSLSKPVVFSNWGFNYIPETNLETERINFAIKKYFINLNDNAYHSKGTKTFISLRNYQTTNTDDEIIVYAWVIISTWYLDVNGNPESDEGSSIPYKIYLERDNGQYKVTRHEMPRDGGYYAEDLKKMMPHKVYTEIMKSHEDGTVQRLLFDNEEQARLYFGK